MNPIESFQRMHARAMEHDAKVILSVVKSDNTNMVVYQAELTTEGNGFTTQTPHGYWQTWEVLRDNQPTHDPLSTLETKMAFGVKIINREPTKITFTLRGYPKIPVTLQIKEGEIVSTVCFSGMDYLFQGIYVHIDGNPTKPKGISLIVKMMDMPETPWFPIYLDRKTKLD